MADVAEAKDEGLLDAASLCNLFEEAEQASYEARQNSERDRDYVDGIQLDAETLAALRKRKQPEIIVNRIKRKIDFLKGYEQSQRISPRALPRTMAHESDAEGCEQALRYVADTERYDAKRSRVWDNLLVEGCGGYSVGVKQGYDGIDITIAQVPWDRMFFDPHSSAPDFSDAGYLGLVRWEDYDEAAAQYPDAKDILTTTLAGVSQSDTYDDKPKYNVWADPKRRRVRICQIWIKREGKWYFAEYTKGGILKAGPSPYVDDKGESVCELLFGSAYVNRDNERYGIVREMIGPQDEINKRRSKALHLLNTNQTIFEEGAVQDVDALRRESAKPDGTIKLNPGGFEKFKMETRLDLATGHMQLLQEAKNEIDMMAGNIALQGNALNQNSASGKAIIASQQGGAMEIAPILDQLRDLDIRVFRAIWFRIRQFWTAEKWIRITDDERNVKWVGLNVDPMQVQQAAMMNPEMGQKIAGVVPSVAELDCDIIIDDAPDSVTPQLEQWQSLVELAKFGVPIPPDVLIKSAPNLRNKDQLLDAMEKAQANAPPPPPDPATVRMQELQVNTELKQKEMAVDAQIQAQKMEQDATLKRQQMLMDQQLAYEKLQAEIAMENEKMQAQMGLERQRAVAQHHAESMKQAKADEETASKKKSESDTNSTLSALAGGTAAIQAALAAMASADTEIVRGPDGRVSGARKVLRNSGQQEAAQ